MRESLLIPGGQNRFQKIKVIREKRVAEGKKVINLGVGEPEGLANIHARVAAAGALLYGGHDVHCYQDNGCQAVSDFARRFVQTNIRTELARVDGKTVSYLPLPGVKPVLQMVVESLGSWQDGGRNDRLVCTMTDPGYPTPADVCQMVRGIRHKHLPLDPANGFLFEPTEEFLSNVLGLKRGDLIMLNIPHNPTGIVGYYAWFTNLCAACEKLGIRIFNDAAYAFLTHSPEAITLTDCILHRFPDLNWVEAFSASKGGDDVDGTMCGWRVGALIGSPEFVSDIGTIKGNVDSGLSAYSAIGVLELFEKHQDDLAKGRKLYRDRLGILTGILGTRGMRLAVEPKAGFFSLFNCPRMAFGQGISSAEHFNQLMIENTGVVGVYFDPYIRYAVCAAPVEDLAREIDSAFFLAQVQY